MAGCSGGAYWGAKYMNAGPILKFFDPLYEYLQQKNFNNGDLVGWEWGTSNPALLDWGIQTSWG
ncbi:hypothetical protein CM15mP5_1350 [bacterium]|nr:MAG: hypothetical protein CM15mP5_1350 [bacterium]